MLHFKTQELDLDEGDTEGELNSWTKGGVPIGGSDPVRIVPPNP